MPLFPLPDTPLFQSPNPFAIPLVLSLLPAPLALSPHPVFQDLSPSALPVVSLPLPAPPPLSPPLHIPLFQSPGAFMFPVAHSGRLRPLPAFPPSSLVDPIPAFLLLPLVLLHFQSFGPSSSSLCPYSFVTLFHSFKATAHSCFYPFITSSLSSPRFFCHRSFVF
ncbi:hypothetical protein EMCG_01210 [[Emmonsia] crescens]|uniref:Uncharacterized protein n=1 Tax=[Emmonsia] crescens TaxID=73230 RepID=A0A0G2I6G0_9EURO|nr:hypothetical protein EMCG_01210 [Emmonsia crescens UAMH 3008]